MEIPARELRNNVSAVLRRVEQGERLTVTVSGRRVAELHPLPTKPMTVPWTQLEAELEGTRADAGLRRELDELLPDTTEGGP